ncbi:MAG: FtsQ-type POTRA domain-containing protein [Alphaproteobacteria bacterium]|nr:FtsQ-type POTRA domain-containing protein [Alphaproteobacteria bacterium]
MRLNLYRMSSGRPMEKLPFYKRRGVRLAGFAGLAFAVALTGFTGYLWRTPLQAQAIEFSVDSGLRLEEIIIKGRVNTTEAELINAIGTPWYDPMLTLDLDRIHHNITALGWVRGAQVERVLPAKLVVTLDERQALALYQDDAGHHVIDHTGTIIAGVKAEDFTHLPVVKGPNAPENAAEILTLLKQQSQLFADVWSLTYQSNRRWDVYLRNNIRIQLPERDTAGAWSKLAAMDREHRLTKRDVINIDLRVPNKIVIRPSRSTVTKGSST